MPPSFVECAQDKVPGDDTSAHHPLERCRYYNRRSTSPKISPFGGRGQAAECLFLYAHRNFRSFRAPGAADSLFLGAAERNLEVLRFALAVPHGVRAYI